MSEFSGAGYEVTEQVKKPGKSMKPGVHVAVISEVNFGKSSQKQTPYIEIVLMGQPIEGLTNEAGQTIGQVCKTTMWMSPGAWNIPGAMWCTKAKLTVMADKLGLADEFAAIQGASEEDFVTKVSAIFKGKKARFLIGGEENQFENDKGETITFVRPHMNTFGFIESLDVPETDSKLVFNEDKMVKRLEVADDVSTDSTTTNTDDAPWG